MTVTDPRATRHWSWASLPVVVLTVGVLFDAMRPTHVTGQAVLAVCVVLVVIAVARHRTTRRVMVRPPVSALVLLAVLFLSVTWSDVPDYTAERMRVYGPLLAAAWMVGASLSQLEFSQVLRWLTRVTLIVVSTLIAVLPWARNPVGDDAEGWHAGYSKNGFGLLLAFCLVCVLIFENGVLLAVAALDVAVLSYGNQSRTSQVTMVVVTAVLFGEAWLAAAKRWFLRRTRLLLLVVGGLGAGALALGASDLVLALMGKDPTLTLRTRIWAAAVPQIEKAPLLGHGAFGFLEIESNSPTRQAVAAYFNKYLPPHAHNGVLDLVGQIGLLGLAAYLAALVSLVWAAWRLPNSRVKQFALVYVVFLLVCGTVEPTFLGPWLVIGALTSGQVSRVARGEPRRADLDARQLSSMKGQITRGAAVQALPSGRGGRRQPDLPGLGLPLRS